MKRSLPFLSLLGWGAYLACSWTWAIGMYLPVFLISKFGELSWLVFVIPNVLGAAALAYVLHRPGDSERMVKEHRQACFYFSLVTIIFQAFFAGWVSAFLPLPGLLLCLLVLVVSFLFLEKGSGSFFSLGVWLASAALLAGILKSAPPWISGLNLPREIATAGRDIFLLIPLCFFGFLLSPYLDLTFHHVRQSLSDSDAKRAFTLGFGVLFLALMVLTLCYARPAAAFLEGKLFLFQDGKRFPEILRDGILFYMLFQAGITSFFHARRLRAENFKLSPFFFSAAVLLSYSVGYFLPIGYLFELSWRQIVYLGFIGFYALIFPAYVLLCVFPGVQTEKGTGCSLRFFLWLAAVLAGLPALAYGFLGNAYGRLPWILVAFFFVGAIRLSYRFIFRKNPAQEKRSI